MGSLIKSISFKVALLISGLALFLVQCDKWNTTEDVLIEDASFAEVLIEMGIDKNRDGSIGQKEAKDVHTLRIWPSEIESLAGIEAFYMLDTLSVVMNPLMEVDLSQNKSLRYLELIGCELQSLDVSANVELTHLDCSSSAAMKNRLTVLDPGMNPRLVYLSCVENELASLDLSKNTALQELHCGYNEIANLDVSSNIQLATLHCNNNQLESLDVSKNTGLKEMITCGNRFVSFDISNNNQLVKIGIDNMPTLHEVCVWVLPFPPQGVNVLMGFSPNVEFIEGCRE